MKLAGKCKILRIFLDENLKLKNQLLYRTIVKKLLELKVAGATVFKAVEGFGSKAHLHDAGVLELSENLPILIEVVDTPTQIRKALKAVEPMLPTHCLVTVQDIQVLHYHAPGGKQSHSRPL
jgi:PII-like signaling protein